MRNRTSDEYVSKIKALFQISFKKIKFLGSHFFQLLKGLVGAATNWEEVILGNHEEWTEFRLVATVIRFATTTSSGRAGQESVIGGHNAAAIVLLHGF